MTPTSEPTTSTGRDDARRPPYDVIVVGGGAAGLSAASVLAAARRSVVVVDGGRPRNGPASHVRGFLSREGVTPADVLADGRREVEAYGGEIRTGDVTAIRRVEVDSDDLARFAVLTDDGSVLEARRLLLATGIVDRLPEIDGLAEQWGSGVHVCPFCHGWDVRDKRLAVLATAQDAVHLALMLGQWSADVTVLLHDQQALATSDARQLDARSVAVVAGEVVQICSEGDRLTGVQLAAGTHVPVDAIFVAPTCEVAAELVDGIGCATAADGSVEADDMGRTSVAGVYAAGNVVDHAAMVMVAAGSGAGAAVAICADLVEEDTERAVRALAPA